MSDAALKSRHMTFEEAAKLDPDSMSGELDAGRWVGMTRGTWRHGEIVGNVVMLLRLFARANGQWSVSTSDPGTKLGHAPDVLRGPDVGVVQRERVPTGKGAEGWLEGAPHVAVEVISDSQSHSEMAKKALEYLSAGAKAVWVLDPEPKRVLVYTPPNEIRVLGPEDTLEGGAALPGFSCKVAELFE